MKFLIGLVALFCASPAQASEGGGLVYFEYMSILLLVGLVGGAIAQRKNQPRVLGWLVVGLIFFNATALLFSADEFGHVPEVHGYVIFGLNLLIFSAGLESNVKTLVQAGPRAMAVAMVGMLLPLLGGMYVVGPLYFPDVPWTGHLFLGAALTATSVSVPAAIFKSLGYLGKSASNTTIGAAVIDDVGGLITLSVVKGIVLTGAVGFAVVGTQLGIAILFLVASTVAGIISAPYIGRFLSRLDGGDEMRLGFVICLIFFFAWIASSIGLDAIVGSFVAGLVLDRVHFDGFREHRLVEAVRGYGVQLRPEARGDYERTLNHYQDEHVEDLIRPLIYVFTAPFFVLIGGSVNLSTLIHYLPTVAGVLVVAVVSKLLAGMLAQKGDRWIVGWSMVPRGEVGLIFATIGNQMGVMNPEMYAVLVSVITLTTLIPALVLPRLLKKA